MRVAGELERRGGLVQPLITAASMTRAPVDQHQFRRAPGAAGPVWCRSPCRRTVVRGGGGVLGRAGAATSTPARVGRSGRDRRRARRRPPPRQCGVILWRSAGRGARLCTCITFDAVQPRVECAGRAFTGMPVLTTNEDFCIVRAQRRGSGVAMRSRGVPPVRIPGRAGRACPGTRYGAVPGGRHGLCHWLEGPRGAYASGRPSEASIVTGEVST